MPVHVEELHSEVAVTSGDLPLSPRQLEALVELVAARIDARQREAQSGAADTAIRPRAARPMVGEE